MQPNDPDEQQWIRSLRQQDRGAFERLLDRYERRVFNLALRLLAGDMSEAEDATQDIFLEVHRSLPRFRGEARLDTWVHRIAVNVCLQRRRKRVLPTAELPDFDLPDPTAGDPFQCAAQGELRETLLTALDHLPAPQRDVVFLHGMQGLSYAEVAEALQCPVGTVKSRLSTGFKRLRVLLQNHFGEAPTEAAPTRVAAPVEAR